jgi:hypothetical protein
MPVFRWFALPEDFVELIDKSLSHPKRLPGLCVVEPTALSPSDFVPNYFLGPELKRKLLSNVCNLLIMRDTNVSTLKIEKEPEFLDHVSEYFVDINHCITGVDIIVPSTFAGSGHELLSSSVISYLPTTWAASEGRRVKAPAETAQIFRFLRDRVRESAPPGINDQLMTAAARDRIEKDGVLFLVDGLWYDSQGDVRGRYHGKDGIVENGAVD